MKDILLMFYLFLRKLLEDDDFTYEPDDLDKMNIIQQYLWVVCENDGRAEDRKWYSYNLSSFITDFIGDLNPSDQYELLCNNSVDGEYDVYQGVFRFLEEEGGTLIKNGINSRNGLEVMVTEYNCREQILDNLYDIWIPQFEEALVERVNKLKDLWRKRRLIKRKEIIEKLPIHSVRHLVMGYL